MRDGFVTRHNYAARKLVRRRDDHARDFTLTQAVCLDTCRRKPLTYNKIK
jgi:hypothetical protein